MVSTRWASSSMTRASSSGIGLYRIRIRAASSGVGIEFQFIFFLHSVTPFRLVARTRRRPARSHPIASHPIGFVSVTSIACASSTDRSRLKRRQRNASVRFLPNKGTLRRRIRRHTRRREGHHDDARYQRLCRKVRRSFACTWMRRMSSSVRLRAAKQFRRERSAEEALPSCSNDDDENDATAMNRCRRRLHPRVCLFW